MNQISPQPQILNLVQKTIFNVKIYVGVKDSFVLSFAGAIITEKTFLTCHKLQV